MFIVVGLIPISDAVIARNVSDAWRSRAYYAAGAPETTVLEAAGTAALQSGIVAADFAQKLS